MLLNWLVAVSFMFIRHLYSCPQVPIIVPCPFFNALLFIYIYIYNSKSLSMVIDSLTLCASSSLLYSYSSFQICVISSFAKLLCFVLLFLTSLLQRLLIFFTFVNSSFQKKKKKSNINPKKKKKNDLLSSFVYHFFIAVSSHLFLLSSTRLFGKK